MKKSRGFEVLDELQSQGWTSAHLVETGRDLDTLETDYSVKVEVPSFSLAGRAFDAVDIYVSEGLSKDQLLVTSYVDRSMEPAGDRVVENVVGDDGAWDEVDRAIHVVLELARYGVSELEYREHVSKTTRPAWADRARATGQTAWDPKNGWADR